MQQEQKKLLCEPAKEGLGCLVPVCIVLSVGIIRAEDGTETATEKWRHNWSHLPGAYDPSRSAKPTVVFVICPHHDPTFSLR